MAGDATGTSAGTLKEDSVCRVFFSSPFNGMEGERETLVKKYWPQLQVSMCGTLPQGEIVLGK